MKKCKTYVLPSRCRRPCCGRYIWHLQQLAAQTEAAQAEQQKLDDKLLPLKKVDVDCHISGAIATLNLELVYKNPSETDTYECSYEFPLSKETVLAKLIAQIDGKTIEAKVKAKEEAKEIYEDAIAAGNAAVLADRQSDKKESMTVKLGNLLPQQEATLSITLIMQLSVLNGSYLFELPLAFYPDYSKHGAQKTDFPYDFSYQVRIESQTKICRLSLPQYAEISSQNDAGTDITIRCNRVSKQINLFYNTRDMMNPQLYYAEDPEKNVVACSASFVPTFEPPNPQEMTEVFDDEEPEAMLQSPGSEFHFVFIVDRSGSMRSQNRMESAKEALKLFMRSLPTGCHFSIYSFGSQFQLYEPAGSKGQYSIEYSQECMSEVLQHVEQMEPNLGGTNILHPLQQVKSWARFNDCKRRVFILTDGQVANKQQVIDAASVDAENARVFTFGLGSGCDKELVEGVAKSGRGTCSIVKDGGNLNSQVIRALQHAMEPSLKACKITWNDEAPRPLNEVFRNQSIFSTMIMPLDKFQSMMFTFASELDPKTKQPIALDFTANDFTVVTGESAKGLFKQAAHEKIQMLTDTAQKVEVSLKYQTLCDDTSLVGVIKQKDKASGEVKEMTVEFGKTNQQQKPVAHSQLSKAKCRMPTSNAMPMMMMGSAMPRGGARGRGGGMAAMNEMRSRAMPSAATKGAPMMKSKKMSKAAAPQEKSLGVSQSVAAFGSAPMEMMEDCMMMESEQSMMPQRQAQMPQARQRRTAAAMPAAAAKPTAASLSMNKAPARSAQSSLAAAPKKSEQAPPKKTQFETLVDQQHTTGFWPAQAKSALLQNLLESTATNDPQIMTALEALSLTDDIEIVYTTLLAIYILGEAFDDKEDEWTLLARKAKAYLKSVGVDKPDKILRLFTAEVKA